MGSLIANAWRDGFATIRRNPSLFTLAFIAFVVIAWCIGRVAPQADAYKSADPLEALLLLCVSTAGGVVQSFVNVPCAIAAHRYVLLGPAGDQDAMKSSNRMVRFFLAGLLISVAFIVPGLIVSIGSVLNLRHEMGTGLVATFAGLILILAAAVVSLRYCLVFPAVATDKEDVWRASWAATRGHWWAIFVTTLVCLLPVWLVGGVFVAVTRNIPSAAGLTLSSLAQGAMSLAAASIGASLLSGFYRKYMITPAEHVAAAVWAT